MALTLSDLKRLSTDPEARAKFCSGELETVCFTVRRTTKEKRRPALCKRKGEAKAKKAVSRKSRKAAASKARGKGPGVSRKKGKDQKKILKKKKAIKKKTSKKARSSSVSVRPVRTRKVPARLNL